MHQVKQRRDQGHQEEERGARESRVQPGGVARHLVGLQRGGALQRQNRGL